MAQNRGDKEYQTNIWFVDNMTGFKKLFSNLNEIEIHNVQLENDDTLHVKGNGTFRFGLISGKHKYLHNIQYISGLDLI